MEAFKNLFTPKGIAIIASAFTGLVLIVAISSLLSPKPVVETTPVPSVSTPVETVTPEPTVTPEVVEVTPLYADCTEVWAALGRPITEADEGYPATKPNIFDADSDGIGCEDNPSTPEDESQIDWQAIWAETKGNAKEFGEWAGPKLKNFWEDFAAPTLDDVWNETKNIFGITR